MPGGGTVKLSDLLRQEMEKRELKTVKDAAGVFGVSIQLLRVMLYNDHIPKDRTLAVIAGRLGLDPAMLVMVAHRQRLPRDLGVFTLTPEPPTGGDLARKRKWPLSQEQCDYLSHIMTIEEIQLIRKYRQLTDEAKTQVVGQINYQFEAARAKKNR